jgi:hypothetical protein
MRVPGFPTGACFGDGRRGLDGECDLAEPVTARCSHAEGALPATGRKRAVGSARGPPKNPPLSLPPPFLPESLPKDEAVGELLVLSPPASWTKPSMKPEVGVSLSSVWSGAAANHPTMNRGWLSGTVRGTASVYRVAPASPHRKRGVPPLEHQRLASSLRRRWNRHPELSNYQIAHRKSYPLRAAYGVMAFRVGGRRSRRGLPGRGVGGCG